jgi:hypothetical protein
MLSAAIGLAVLHHHGSLIHPRSSEDHHR